LTRKKHRFSDEGRQVPNIRSSEKSEAGRTNTDFKISPTKRVGDSGGVQGLDHHTFLSLIREKNSSALAYSLQGIDHFMETACSTSLLRKAGNAKVGFLSVLDDSHDFAGELNFFHVKI
jgi:hypothetical protein